MHAADYVVIRNHLAIVHIARLNDCLCYVLLTAVVNQTECCVNYYTIFA